MTRRKRGRLREFVSMPNRPSLHEEELAALTVLAAGTGRSRDALIREAVSDLLDKYQINRGGTQVE